MPFFFRFLRERENGSGGTREGRAAEYPIFQTKFPGSHGPDGEQHKHRAHVQKEHGGFKVCIAFYVVSQSFHWL